MKKIKFPFQSIDFLLGFIAGSASNEVLKAFVSDTDYELLQKCKKDMEKVIMEILKKDSNP